MPAVRRARAHRRARARARAAAFTLSTVLGLTGCLTGCSGTSSGAPAKVTGQISLTYLQKQGGQQYFKDEAASARTRAAMVDAGSWQGAGAKCS